MEENKQKKFSLKKVILYVFTLLIVVTIVVLLALYDSKTRLKNDILKSTNSKSYEEVSINDNTYYERLNNKTWKGQYHQSNFHTANGVASVMEVVSYTKYLDIINSINSKILNKINNYYSNKDCNYIILSYANGNSWCKMDLIDCFEDNNKIIIYGDEESNGFMAEGSGYFIAIPTNMPEGTEIEYRECYTSSEISNLNQHNTTHTPSELLSIDKPIIYLYPTEETEVSVKLLKNENLTCSYPRYKDGWKVLAQSNGNLKDLNTNRQLYSLYYESKSNVKYKVENEGFVVKGEDTIKFLEDKLAILGLTEKEAEEFIVYWLPKLQTNKYNYIRFATTDEINENMPLDINPNPDTIIRVLMTFKGLETPIDVQEQQLESPNRTGFVAVEWGGTEIK